MGDGGACALGRGARLTVLVTKEEEQRGAKGKEQLMSGRVVKEEEQRGVKKEEQLMGGRVALAAALAAAAIAVWQGGIARTCASTDVSQLVAPLRADFVVRASSSTAGASPGVPAPRCWRPPHFVDSPSDASAGPGSGRVRFREGVVGD